MKKGVPIEAVPVPDEDYFDSIRPDDPNNKWHMEYCYWEAKPNPAETNEGIPQKLMIKSFPEDYYTTGSKDYNPAGELEETAEGTDEIIGNLTGNATLNATADELVGNLTGNVTESGLTLLQVACKDGDESLVKLLSEELSYFDRAVNESENAENWTPLLWASHG